MSIAIKIKDLRTSRRYTQKDLAKLLNVKPTTVSGWELGRNEPSISMINTIADLFNVTSDYLLGRPEKNDNNNTADLANEDTIFTYEGKPIPPEDLKYIKRILLGDRK